MEEKSYCIPIFLAKKRTLPLQATSIPLQSVQVLQTEFPFRAEILFRHLFVTIRLIKWTPEQPPGWKHYSEFCSEHLDWLLCLIWMHINDTWYFLWNVMYIMQHTNTRLMSICFVNFLLFFLKFLFLLKGIKNYNVKLKKKGIWSYAIKCQALHHHVQNE